MTGKGFILSRRTIRRDSRECVELWISTENGPVRLISEPQTSVCFIRTSHLEQVQNLIRAKGLDITPEAVNFKTLEQEEVILLRCADDFTRHKLRRGMQSAGLPLYEGDIKSEDRFLMERFAYGAVSFYGTQVHNEVVNAKVKGAQFRPQLTSVSVDIECDEKENLYSIAVASETMNRVWLNTAGTTPVTDEFATFDVINLPGEKEVLTAFCRAVAKLDPDVILGWNIKQFDLAVLNRMARRQGIPLTLGRQGETLTVREWEDGSQVIAEIPGRCIIDGIDALKTMTWQFESFALDFVANALLKKGKLITGGDKLEEIKALYRDNPSHLVAYNYQDCVLVNDIAEHTRFIDFLILRSTLTGLDMTRPGGSVAAFINVYLPKLHRQGYVCGIRPENGGLASPGGYVMTSRPGLYNNVLVLDFKSLYPSIIRTFLIDPLGLAEGLLHPENAIEGYRGAMFSRTEHFLPDIIAGLWQQRDEAKKQQDAPRSQAIKILMNSFYGVLGSGGCPFYDPRLASSITMRGHDIMQTTAGWIEDAGYEVIYGDTDSTFVFTGDDCTPRQAELIGTQLQDMINRRWRETLKQDFNLHCHLEIEFETHFRRFFMPTIRGSEEGSKKRYAGVVVKEGKEQLIFKGLENVRSDWTALARQFQEKLYALVFAERSPEDYIRSLLSDIRAGKLDDFLVYARRLRKPLNAYTRTQPPHVKAARQADEMNLATGKPLQYQHKTTVRYVVTIAGPQAVGYVTQPPDYEHYIEKQIRPIAESILPATGINYDDIDNQQLGLF
ncbi:DNA polymerase II [Alteromonas sp. RKMC-009]|uniref:DNA polymerase II n=1 Tax=Alteromonas sp. RKMC-009 TaxID=2267264 RepID=UPI000E67D5D4|nr:DNA polymerase II [Alteromonas sp. RKMC-009]AYA65647.1 DNA polymerase II [Alteromonas sp. RKMC-009]